MALPDIRAGATARTSEHQRPVRPASRGRIRRHHKIDQLRLALEARPRVRRRFESKREFESAEWPVFFFPLRRAARGPRLCDVLRRVSRDTARRARRRQAPRAHVCRRRACALGAREGWISSRAGSLLDRAAIVQRHRRAEPVREGRQAAGVLRRGSVHHCAASNDINDGCDRRAEGGRRVRLPATGKGHTSGAHVYFPRRKGPSVGLGLRERANRFGQAGSRALRVCIPRIARVLSRENCASSRYPTG